MQKQHAFIVAVFAAAFCLEFSSRADNQIVQWGNAPPAAYTIDQFNATVRINQGAGYIFKFYAVDGGNPGLINNIYVDAGAAGNFQIWIQHPNSPFIGAGHLRQCDLQYPGGTSTLRGMTLSGSLGQGGPVRLESVDGPITVGYGGQGHLLHTLVVQQWNNTYGTAGLSVTGNVPAGADVWVYSSMPGNIWIGGNLAAEMNITGGHMTGSTTIGSLSGKFRVTNAGLLGPLHVTGNVTDGGVIFVKGSCTAPIDIDGNFAGSLSIGWEPGHDLRAALTIDGACTGDITITRVYSDASSQGSINIGQNCTGDISIGNSMNGPVNIGGSLAGTLAVGATWGGGNIQQNVSIGGHLRGNITANGSLSAEIQINGSLINGSSQYDIELTSRRVG